MRFRSSARRLLLIIVTWLGLGAIGVTLAETEIDLDAILKKIQTERERLQSGVFRIVGTASQSYFEVTDKEGAKPTIDNDKSTLVRILCAFDFNAGQIRVDRTLAPWEPTWLRPTLAMRAFDLETSAEKKADMEAVARQTFLVRTPQSNFYFRDGQAAVEARRPNKDEQRGEYGAAWADVRAFGLYCIDDLFEGSDFAAKMSDCLTNRAEKQVTREGTTAHIKYINVQGYEWNYWIDLEQKFTVVRSLERPPVYKSDPPAWGEPDVTSEIEWKEMSGVYVPTSLHTVCRNSLGPKKYRTREIKWTIGWDSINQPVDAKYFDYKQVPLPSGTRIAGSRLGFAIMADTPPAPPVPPKAEQH